MTTYEHILVKSLAEAKEAMPPAALAHLNTNETVRLLNSIALKHFDLYLQESGSNGMHQLLADSYPLLKGHRVSVSIEAEFEKVVASAVAKLLQVKLRKLFDEYEASL